MSTVDTSSRWKLGKDMISSDTILDSVTFDDLILALKCNCEHITPDAVIVQATEIINQRLEDVKYLIENNIDEIIALASDEPLEDAGHDDITLEE
ncbi:hypothetical protein [Faecalibacterium prausnitzii]|jgi:hypothetical protein|uniref:hypothetical protein n=1 Tax=Faecalibacterium prausnitzii TaxID=853 RepID=UPI0022E46CA1|nr:hypothetical protein [Faecalibacterium prausnitzii]